MEKINGIFTSKPTVALYWIILTHSKRAFILAPFWYVMPTFHNPNKSFFFPSEHPVLL